jgi:broad specificity phosphatase PhoE
MPPDDSVVSVIVMRHGETEWNKESRVMGRSDIPLSDAGRRQSERAAAVLAHFSVDRIVSSPLVRAKETADIVSRHLDVDVQTDEQLQEVEFGSWQGMTYREIRADPRYGEFLKDPVNNRTPGGENIADVQSRGLAAIAAAKPGERVLFVSHGDIIRAAISYFLDVPLRQFRRIRVDNCGLTAIAVADGRPEVKFVNMLADPERAWDPLHWSTRT